MRFSRLKMTWKWNVHQICLYAHTFSEWSALPILPKLDEIANIASGNLHHTQMSNEHTFHHVFNLMVNRSKWIIMRVMIITIMLVLLLLIFISYIRICDARPSNSQYCHNYHLIMTLDIVHDPHPENNNKWTETSLGHLAVAWHLRDYVIVSANCC